MPGPNATYAEATDLFPADEEGHRKLLSEKQDQLRSAQDARQPFDERWTRFYRLYRSYKARKAGDWRSRVFIPISFWVVETITPRLVAQLPKPLVLPVGPEDEEPAKAMEQLLEYAFDQSEVFLELVEAYKSALMYGTGILKVYYDDEARVSRKSTQVPVLEDVTEPRPVPDAESPDGLLHDPDGEVVTEDQVVGQRETGEYKTETSVTVLYDGPMATWVDIMDFWVAPEARRIKDARYVIHRSVRPWKEIEEKIEEGVYKFPDHMERTALWNTDDEPTRKRLEEIGLSIGPSDSDPSRRPVELLEFWEDDRVTTLANRTAVIRVQENPFDHGEKPFVRVVDHIVPGEFWGVGELESMEGLQDKLNAETNARIDNLKLVLNAMFAVNEKELKDLNDLQNRPGGVVRMSGDRPISEVFQRIELGDVTPNAYHEVETTMRLIEQVTAVSPYQTGTDPTGTNDTATGAAIIQEAGATRFFLKTKLAELTGVKALARMYGSIIQQFWPAEKAVRLAGPRGQFLFETFTPESISGALDYDIETGSSTQTETVRKDQSLSLLQTLATYLPPQTTIDPMTGQPSGQTMHPGVEAAIEDVLEAFGKKDMARYLGKPKDELPEGAKPPGPEGNGAVTPELAAAVDAMGAQGPVGP